jgi:tetratricopeptide (TPR) repeat protein
VSRPPAEITRAAPTLDAGAEAEWQRLHRQLELAEGFWLAFLCTDWTAAGHLLAERWGEFLRARVKRLDRIVLARPKDIGKVLDRLFDKATTSAGGVWIEAMGVDPPGLEHGPWQQARRTLLARLNERRERLRRQFPGGVLIALPAVGKVEARDEAPDLWTIRSLVLEPKRSLETKRRVRKSEEGKQKKAKAEEQVGKEERIEDGTRVELDPETAELLRTAHGHLAAGRSGPAVTAALEAAQRLQGVSAEARASAIAIAAQARFNEDDWPAAADLFEQALAAAALENPSRAQATWAHLACQAAVHFDLHRALENALQSVRLARLRAKDSREALEDLSVGLSWVGGLQARLGDLESASSAFYQSLELRRGLLAESGESAEALEALCFCLEAIGYLKGQSGELGAALAAYLESLVLRRRLLSKFGETLGNLRSLAATLERLGDVRAQLGDDKTALACYIESRGLRRRLLADFGETVETLDDLAYVLTRIDVLRMKTGYGGAAMALRQELEEVSARRAALFPARSEAP